MTGCFNCGDSNHISKYCQKPQRYTRCVVCECAFTHKHWCTNKSFQSQVLRSTVRSSVEIMIEFSGIVQILVVDQGVEKAIENTPLFLVNQNAFLKSNFPTPSPMKRLTCTFACEPYQMFEVNLVDESENVCLHLEIGPTMYRVNNRYIVRNEKSNGESFNGESVAGKVNIKMIGNLNFVKIYKFGACKFLNGELEESVDAIVDEPADGPNEVESNEMESNEMESNEVEPNEVEPNEVEPIEMETAEDESEISSSTNYPYPYYYDGDDEATSN